jgi:hypothetical protein
MKNSRRMRWAGLVAHMRAKEVLSMFGGKARRKQTIRTT